jgi:hypothetical protein
MELGRETDIKRLMEWFTQTVPFSFNNFMLVQILSQNHFILRRLSPICYQIPVYSISPNFISNV